MDRTAQAKKPVANTRLEILRLLGEGKYAAQIAKDLKLARPTISEHIRALIKEGRIIERKDERSSIKFYDLTGGANRGLTSPTNDESHRIPDHQGPALLARAHDFGMSYKLEIPLAAREAARLMMENGLRARAIPLRGNTQGEVRLGKVTIRLTTKHLTFYTKDLLTDNRTETIDLEASLKPYFDALAKGYEEKLGLRLERVGEALVSRIIKQHYAEEHHPAAEASKQSPLVLARSPIDNQRRLGVDESKGFREFEYYHHLTANVDKDTLDMQFNEVLDGRLNLLDINTLRQIIGHQASTIDRLEGYLERKESQDAEFRRQIELHLGVMRKIDRRLGQRRLP